MKSVKQFAAGLAFGVSVLAMSAGAQAQTLYEAMAMAYQSNPELQAERANLRATDEGLVQARSIRQPTINASGSYGYTTTQSTNGLTGLESNRDTDPASVALTLNQSVYRGGRTDGTIDQATAFVSAGRENLRATEQTVIVDAVTAFMDVYRDTEVIAIRRNNVAVLAEQQRAAEDRFEVGEITRTDVAQAVARLSGAQAQLASAQAGLAASRASYERVTGSPPATLSEPPELPALPEDLASAAAYAFSNSPTLLAAQYSEQAAVQGVRVARGALRPEFSINASASAARNSTFSGDERESAQITGQLTMPIFTGGLNRSRVREAVANEEQARNQVLVVRRAVTEGVTNAWNGYVASLAVIESSEQAVIANEIALDGVEQEALVGLRTTLNVLDAEQELLDSRLTLVSAQRDSYVAAYALLQAMGALSAQQLGLDVDYYEPAPTLD